VAYHANAVPIKDNENKRTRNASGRPILLIALRNGLCAHACSFLGHPKFLRIRVSGAPMGMGGGRIGYHKVSDMTAPGTMLTPSLSRNAPAISSLTISIAAGGRLLALWSDMGEVVWILACCFPPPPRLVWVLWRINICPMWLIGTTVSFQPSIGRKVLTLCV
jgi:hypothetical protein